MRKCSLFISAVAVFFWIFAIPQWYAAVTDSPGLSETPLSHSNVRRLPFSFEQVTRYFDDAFEKPGHTVRNNMRQYIESNAFEEYTAIVVSGRSQRIKVALVTNGNWGVNYIREFFEAPFFLRSESEQLYTLLNASPSARSANLGRFDVQIEVFETRKSIVITAEFGPPGSYQSPGAR
jgi:hypothetical protein